MEFSSIVLMEVDFENKFVKELGSYKVEDGAEYVKKFYFKDNKVFLIFDTGRDVEDWEFSAMYDFFNLDAFTEKGLEMEEKDDEYNPTWMIKFDFIDDIKDMEEKLEKTLLLIHEEMEKAFAEAATNKEEYIEMLKNEA